MGLRLVDHWILDNRSVGRVLSYTRVQTSLEADACDRSISHFLCLHKTRGLGLAHSCTPGNEGSPSTEKIGAARGKLDCFGRAPDLISVALAVAADDGLTQAADFR